MSASTRDDFSFADLFEFIKKNKNLPEAINAVNLNQPYLQTIIKELKSGNLDLLRKYSEKNDEVGGQNKTETTYPTIFDPNNPNNQVDMGVFILSLFKNNEINCREFVTLYNIYLALIELPTNNIHKIPLVSDGELTKEGDKYIDDVIKQYNDNYKIVIDKEKFKQHVLNMSPIEQTLLKIKITEEEYDENRRVWKAYLEVYPMQVSTKERSAKIPSASIFQAFLHQLNPEPITVRPIFGSVGNETLLRLHRADQQPCSLFHPLVISSVPTVHGTISGKLSIALHDLFHTHVASMLSKESREKIFTFTNEVIESIAASNQSEPIQPELKTMLDQLIYEQINDLDINIEEAQGATNKSKLLSDTVQSSIIEDLLSKSLNVVTEGLVPKKATPLFSYLLKVCEDRNPKNNLWKLFNDTLKRDMRENEAKNNLDKTEENRMPALPAPNSAYSMLNMFAASQPSGEQKNPAQVEDKKNKPSM